VPLPATRRSFAVRFALVYLWASSRCDRRPFDELWRALTQEPSAAPRFTLADIALLGIYRALGIERDQESSMILWRRWAEQEGHGGKR
jgi:hypothetical protein